MRLGEGFSFRSGSGPPERSPERFVIDQTGQGRGEGTWAGTSDVLVLVTVSVLMLFTWSSLYLSICLSGLSLPKSDLSKIVFDKKIYIALIVQFRFKHCNGTVKGQKID